MPRPAGNGGSSTRSGLPQSQEELDRIIAQRVEAALQRRADTQGEEQLSPEQKTIADGMCRRLAQDERFKQSIAAEVVKQLKVATDAEEPEDEEYVPGRTKATEANRPEYGNGLGASDIFRKWRKEMEQQGYKFSGWDGQSIVKRPDGQRAAGSAR